MGRRRKVLTLLVAAVVMGGTAGALASSAGSATRTLYLCVTPSGVADGGVRTSPSCPAADFVESWSVNETPPTTTATTTPTTVATTTAPSTTQPTTTTQPSSGAFLSYPHQSGPQSYSGANVTVSNRSYVGFGSVCLTVHDATNVYIHDIDFDGCVGGIFLLNVTGTVHIEHVRARNTGNGTAGSGKSNVIQLNNVFSSAGRINDVKAYGGLTEDAISIFKSGGTDAAHPLVIEDVHIEHPLTGPLAWTSGSGTCINLADAGGSNITLQASTFLSCGAVGIQMNLPAANVIARNNILYGAARPTSNVGLSQYGTCTCSANQYVNNRVWWVKATGAGSALWLQHPAYYSSVSGNVLQDTTIVPANLRVAL